MLPYRGRGRGRGRGNSSFKGRGRGDSNTILQHGRGKLIASNIANTSTSSIPDKDDPLRKEFIEFLKSKKAEIPPSYAQAIIDEEQDESSEYTQNSYQEDIIILETQDIIRYFEDGNDPWNTMSRYLDTASYAAGSYKQRSYYENLLTQTGTCEFKHFYPGNDLKQINFSKCIINRIISIDQWGINPLQEKEFQFHNVKVKSNYWDYIESFNKAFLYQNQRKKHSWFFKIKPEVYNHRIPNWFIKWWRSYGPSAEILPSIYKEFYSEYIEFSEKLIEAVCRTDGPKEVLPSLHFFTEFSIPWIWRWSPEVDYSPNNLPTLKRNFYTKFWQTMLRKDRETGKLESQDTIDYIQKTLIKYKEQKEFRRRKAVISPYQQIENQLKAQGKLCPSKEEIIESYLTQMKEDLVKNLGVNLSSSQSDASMKTISDDENQYACLAGESQPEEEMPLEQIEDVFEEIKNTLIQSVKGKEIALKIEDKKKE